MTIRQQLQNLAKASMKAWRAQAGNRTPELEAAWDAAANAERAFREKHQLVGVSINRVRG